MKTRSDVVQAARRHSLHDDTVRAVRIIPATSRRRSSRIEIDLTEYVTDRPRMLVLRDCAAISFNADFNTLTWNAFANVGWLEVDGSPESVRDLIRRQMPHTNLEYDPPTANPTLRQVDDVTCLVLFRLRLFGGTLEVAARGFALSRPRVTASVSRAAALQEDETALTSPASVAPASVCFV